MIKLHRHKDSPKADEITERLDDLIISYKTVLHDSDQKEKSLPAIEDGGQFIINPTEINSWFEQLRKELEFQRSLSGDGCYIDPDSGEVC